VAERSDFFPRSFHQYFKIWRPIKPPAPAHYGRDARVWAVYGLPVFSHGVCSALIQCDDITRGGQ